MAKPVVNYIFPFDATESKKITFTYTGDLPYQNRLIIYNADTLDVIYDVTSLSRVLYCTLPKNICINGLKYAAAIQCFDMYGSPSSISDKRYFWCLEQPSFYFSNVTDKQTVTTSSFYAEVFYSQSQRESLAQFQFFIYDSNKVLLSESQVFYSTDYLTYNYTGLEDDTVYFIRAKGLTQYGTALDTGYVEIDVNTSYDNVEYNKINAECNENNGLVTYYTNFTIVNTDEDADDYQYEDSIIDLTNDELSYSTGISVEGDFILCIRIQGYGETGTLLTASDELYGFTLTSYLYDDSYMRFKLTVPNGLTPYILYSDPYIPTPTTVFTIYIKRVNNIYQLYVFTSAAVTDNDMHFGVPEPGYSTLPEGIDYYANSSKLELVEYEASVLHYPQYNESDVIAVRISEPNPANARLNINSIGSLPIYESVVPIQANAFSHDGVYVFRLDKDDSIILPDEDQSELFNPGNYYNGNIQVGLAKDLTWRTHNYYGEYTLSLSFTAETGDMPVSTGLVFYPSLGDSVYGLTPIAYSKAPFTANFKLGDTTHTIRGNAVTRNGITYYVGAPNGGWDADAILSASSRIFEVEFDISDDAVWDIAYTMEHGTRNENLIASYIDETEIPTPDLHDVWLNNNNAPTVEILKGNINKYIMDDEPTDLADKRFDIWIGRWTE